MISHRFYRLRKQMEMKDVDMDYLAGLLGFKSADPLYKRLRNETQFRLDEMYTICRELNWPGRLDELFPPEGMVLAGSPATETSGNTMANALRMMAGYLESNAESGEAHRHMATKRAAYR